MASEGPASHDNGSILYIGKRALEIELAVTESPASMPILHLRTDTAQPCGRFYIVGHYGVRPFVKHSAILKFDTALRYGSENILVWHIGPPLVAGPITSSAVQEKGRKVNVHIVGFMDLDADDIEGIETWLADVDKEDRPQGQGWEFLSHYRVAPPNHWIQSENGTPLYRQFSCVGFVMDCYRFIGIDLVDDSRDENLPEVALEMVVAAYGPAVKRESLRDRFGIPGAGPWRIVLAGYIFHSLNRDSDTIRHTPYVPAGIDDKDFQVDDSAPESASGSN